MTIAPKPAGALILPVRGQLAAGCLQVKKATDLAQSTQSAYGEVTDARAW